jgi:hypothetical protein
MFELPLTAAVRLADEDSLKQFQDQVKGFAQWIFGPIAPEPMQPHRGVVITKVKLDPQRLAGQWDSSINLKDKQFQPALHQPACRSAARPD